MTGTWINWSSGSMIFNLIFLIFHFFSFTKRDSIWLTHFRPLIYFYTPWKHQKTSGFLMFPGGVEETSGMKWVNLSSFGSLKEAFLTYRCHRWNIHRDCCPHDLSYFLHFWNKQVILLPITPLKDNGLCYKKIDYSHELTVLDNWNSEEERKSLKD